MSQRGEHDDREQFPTGIDLILTGIETVREAVPPPGNGQSCRRPYGLLYFSGKGMPRISAKNQITIPVSALEEVGLHAGERVMVEPAGDGELRVRRAALSFDDAFGVLTGAYPVGYLEQLDAEDADR